MPKRFRTDGLSSVSKSLPFRVDDYDEVNTTFRRSVEGGNPTDRMHIEIWTYYYVHQYFAVHFLRSPGWLRSDADRLIDVTLRRLRKSRGQLRDPGLYTFWVSAACRNAYTTYVRGKRMDGLPDPDSLVAESQTSSPYDMKVMYEALESGIGRLPPFLQDTARMRLIEGRPYREISEATGKPVPTLRSYANRALVTLRKDALILRVFGEIRG